MIALVSQSGLAITESAVPRRSIHYCASSPLERSSLPEYLGGKTGIFRGYFKDNSQVFQGYFAFPQRGVHCALALLAGDEHYSSLLAVWNFERYHASHFPHAGTVLEYLAPFLWHHSSPLGDCYSGTVQAQDAPAHLALPVLRRYSQIGVGSGRHRGSLVAKMVLVDYPPRGGKGIG